MDLSQTIFGFCIQIQFSLLICSSSSPNLLLYKQQSELLNVLLLSYPLSRIFLRDYLQVVLNELLGVVVYFFIHRFMHSEMKSSQQPFLSFFQRFLFLYPDLRLDLHKLPEKVNCNTYSESEIGNELQTYYLKPWNTISNLEVPPNGNYLSDNSGTFTIDGNYERIIPSASVWYSLRSPLENSIMKFIHPNPNQKSQNEQVYILQIQPGKVLYWVCPQCTFHNDQPGACRSCNCSCPEVLFVYLAFTDRIVFNQSTIFLLPSSSTITTICFETTLFSPHPSSDTLFLRRVASICLARFNTPLF